MKKRQQRVTTLPQQQQQCVSMTKDGLMCVLFTTLLPFGLKWLDVVYILRS